MLTDLCQELRNWFDRDMPKFAGTFHIHNSDIFKVAIDGSETSIRSLGLADNQYFRIYGSVFNDGVIQYTRTSIQALTEEQYDGAVWFMAVPPSVILLNSKIDDWQTKYGDASFSPYTSESFGGYSYSKGSNSAGSGNANTWQNAFKSELNKWRKL